MEIRYLTASIPHFYRRGEKLRSIFLNLLEIKTLILFYLNIGMCVLDIQPIFLVYKINYCDCRFRRV